MFRTSVTLLLLVPVCLIFFGCATVDRARPPAPQAPAAAAPAREAQISIKMPAKEWRQIVNPAEPQAIVFENQQTTAVVSIQLFPTTARTVEDMAGELFTRMSAKGLEVDDPVMGSEQSSFTFRGVLNEEPFEGRIMVKRMPGRPAEASFFALGVWPKKFDQKMAKDYEAIVASVRVVDGP